MEFRPVRCTATLKSGRPCHRAAQASSSLCGIHARVEEREVARFYAEQLSPDERQALAEAAALQGIDAEIAVLRILIRRFVTLGDIDKARRGIESLCRTLKARHDLDDRSADQLASSLERVLDNLGEEMGVAL